MSGPLPDSPQAWLDRARSDLALAQVALRTPGVLAADACFHAQQCAEKSLKALLVHKGIEFPRTHVIEALFDLAQESDVEVPVSIDDIVRLTQYAVETRYPGAWEPIDSDEAKGAVVHAARMLSWVESMIGDPDGAPGSVPPM